MPKNEYNPTKPCNTCDDEYVFFAGEWSHCGTMFDERCPAITPGLNYITPEQRKSSYIAKYGEDDWNKNHNN